MCRPSGRGARWAAVVLLVLVFWAVRAPAARSAAESRARPPIELVVVTTPMGAEVTLESLTQLGLRRVGRADGELRLRVPPGTYRVEARLSRYRLFTQVLALEAAQRLKLTLEPAVARLDVATPGSDNTARGGELRIDGQIAGVVPVPVEVTAGRHQIEVVKPGYRPFRETLELESRESRTLWVTLQAEVRSGSLLVTAAQGTTRVIVDGQDRGPAPLLLDNLPEGEHQIEVRGAAASTRHQVRIVAGRQTLLPIP